MSLKEPFYFCSECKKVLKHLDELLFVDEYSHKGFCSEECIEDFHFPLIKHFEIAEHSLRSKLGLFDEVALSEDIDQDMVEEVLTNPTEVYRQGNEVQETYYYFIKRYPLFTTIIIASVYRKEASFIFLTTITKSEQFLKEFRYGEVVTDWFVKSSDDEIDEENSGPELSDFDGTENSEDDQDSEEAFVFMQLLESKKSKLLADIIINRLESDIPFEDYPGYESCFQDTLDQPDEVFEKKDNEGDMIFTYIKSFSNFFYIVACLKRSTDETKVSVYPILGIPTKDIKLCQEFRGGTKLAGPLKN